MYSKRVRPRGEKKAALESLRALPLAGFTEGSRSLAIPNVYPCIRSRSKFRWTAYCSPIPLTDPRPSTEVHESFHFHIP